MRAFVAHGKPLTFSTLEQNPVRLMARSVDRFRAQKFCLKSPRRPFQ
jgi:hypothetical protein